MSYKLIKSYADQYAPLTHQEELQATSLLDTTASLALLIKHNARGLVKLVNPWMHTYGNLDDPTSVATLALVKSYKNYNNQVSPFWYWARLRVKAALHRYQPKTRPPEVDIATLEIEDSTQRPYSDLDSILQTTMSDILTEKEQEFIKDIYYRGLSVSEAGDNYGFKVAPSKSRKHKELLLKLRQYVGEDSNQCDTSKHDTGDVGNKDGVNKACGSAGGTQGVVVTDGNKGGKTNLVDYLQQ